jgi:hypothetical protein
MVRQIDRLLSTSRGVQVDRENPNTSEVRFCSPSNRVTTRKINLIPFLHFDLSAEDFVAMRQLFYVGQ